MEVTVEQLIHAMPKFLTESKAKTLLQTIGFVANEGGKAWVHPYVLASIGIREDMFEEE